MGPSFMLHSVLEMDGAEMTPKIAPMAAVRVGFSAPWSRLGRRVFTLFEPKVRLLTKDGEMRPDLLIAVVVGSGRGVR